MATKLQHCKQRGSIGAILYNTVGSSGDFIIGPEQDVEMRAAVIGLRVASISYGHYSVLRGYDSRPVRVRAKEVSQSRGVRRGVRGCFAFLPFFNTKITMEIPDVFYIAIP